MNRQGLKSYLILRNSNELDKCVSCHIIIISTQNSFDCYSRIEPKFGNTNKFILYYLLLATLPVSAPRKMSAAKELEIMLQRTK